MEQPQTGLTIEQADIDLWKENLIKADNTVSLEDRLEDFNSTLNALDGSDNAIWYSRLFESLKAAQHATSAQSRSEDLQQASFTGLRLAITLNGARQMRARELSARAEGVSEAMINGEELESLVIQGRRGVVGLAMGRLSQGMPFVVERISNQHPHLDFWQNLLDPSYDQLETDLTSVHNPVRKGLSRTGPFIPLQELVQYSLTSELGDGLKGCSLAQASVEKDAERVAVMQKQLELFMPLFVTLSAYTIRHAVLLKADS